MLILTRKPGESVMVEDVEIVVLKSQGGRFRLGFKASPDVRIVRKELLPIAKQDNGHNV